MASISNENGRRSIQFVAADGKRRTIRLGKCDHRTAEGVKLHIERLVEARITTMPVHVDTANWLRSLGDELHDRVARVGLTSPRNAEVSLTLGVMLETYIARRKADMKPWSIKMLEQAKRKLVAFYGVKKPVLEITAADAMDFKRAMGTNFSTAYVAKLVVLARQFFRDALDRELINRSPFAKVKPGSQRNPERQRFIGREVIDKVIKHAPDAEWKLIIALARYGGVRVPSEILALKWVDVRWDENKILIRASKTEHFIGKATRLIPLYPELRPYLEAARKEADEDAVHAIVRYRDPTVNLRTQFQRILQKAGVEPWPKLFQNLRSTRQTELAEEWPLHIVCAWQGNSEVIARGHYLQVTSAHFEKAAGLTTKTGGAESGAVPARMASHGDAPTSGENSGSPESAVGSEKKHGSAS